MKIIGQAANKQKLRIKKTFRAVNGTADVILGPGISRDRKRQQLNQFCSLCFHSA